MSQSEQQQTTGAAAHTPGPWATAATPDRLIVSGRTKIAAAYEVDGDVWGAANARLIAAAPDLLEFARHYDGYMSANYSGPDSGALHPSASETWTMCRAAIAKATGQ